MSSPPRITNRDILKRLPWFYGWNVLAVGMLSMAILVGIVFSSFSFFAVAWMDELGTSRAETMLIMTFSQLVTGVLYPFAGSAMDRWEIRRVAAVGIMLFALGMVLSGLAQNLWQVVLTYGVLMAAGNALAGTLLAQTLAAKWFRRQRGLALGLAATGSSFGALFFPVLVASLLDFLDWRTVMMLLGGLSAAIMLPLLAWIVGNSPEQFGVTQEPPGAQLAAGDDDEFEWSVAGILRERFFWFALAAFIPVIAVPIAMTSNLASLGQDVGASQQATGLLMSIWSIATIVGKVAVGMLADRVEQRVLYGVTVAFLLTSLALLAIGGGYWMLVSVMIAMGLSSGGYMPLVTVMLSRHFGALSFGRANGLFLLCIRPVAFVPPLAGWVRDSTDSYLWFWVGAALLCMAATPCAGFLTARPGSGQNEEDSSLVQRSSG